MNPASRAIATAVAFTLALAVFPTGAAGAAAADWPAGKSYDVNGLRVTVSAPVPVGRAKHHFWYPQVVRLPDGPVVNIIRLGGDTVAEDDGVVCWSDDGGRTWGKPVPYTGQSYCQLAVPPSGDLLLLPYHLYPREGGGVGGPYNVIRRGRREVERVKDGVRVTGFPRPLGTNAVSEPGLDQKLGRASWYFDGQPVRLKDGSFLATLYGTFEGAKRYSSVAAVSDNGLDWVVRSVIADEACGLDGVEGPCEPTLCRLKDGRILCLLRLESGKPFGQCFSDDEGKTWSRPVAVKPFSVEPTLAVLEGGAVVLGGGRPGIFLWLDREGGGTDWGEPIDVLRHHNHFVPGEPLDEKARVYGSSATSSYTELAALDGRTLLFTYDRNARAWPATEKAQGEADTDSVWVVRVTVEPRPLRP